MILSFLALAAWAPASTLPPISLAPAGAGYSASTPSFPGIFLSSVNEEVARRARSTCSGKGILWEEFKQTEKLGKQLGEGASTITDYRRDFRCVDATPATHVRAPDNWKPSSSDEVDVRRFFGSYYSLRDSGAASKAVALFDSNVVGDPKKWGSDVAAFNLKLGQGKRRITGVTWYVNPAQAERAGVFAAIDFIGEYPSMHFYCGYLMLFRRGAGSYDILREEQNQFARSDDVPKPAQLAEMRAAMCREN